MGTSLIEIFKDYGPAIAWLTAAIGWMVANNHANRRELRKEIRDDVKELQSLIESIQSDLISLHQLDGGSAESDFLAQRVRFLFRSLDMGVQQLGQHAKFFGLCRLIDLDDVKDASNCFFNQVTNGDFDSKTRKAKSNYAISFAISKDSSAALRLIEKLKKSFIDAFG